MNGGAKLDRAGDLGARFLAHQIGKPARQLALVGFREAAIEHVRNHQTEHMVAEKLEALIRGSAIARPFERRNVCESAVAQRQILESITDAFFERAAAAAAAGLLAV